MIPESSMLSTAKLIVKERNSFEPVTLPKLRIRIQRPQNESKSPRGSKSNKLTRLDLTSPNGKDDSHLQALLSKCSLNTVINGETFKLLPECAQQELFALLPSCDVSSKDLHASALNNVFLNKALREFEWKSEKSTSKANNASPNKNGRNSSEGAKRRKLTPKAGKATPPQPLKSDETLPATISPISLSLQQTPSPPSSGGLSGESSIMPPPQQTKTLASMREKLRAKRQLKLKDNERFATLRGGIMTPHPSCGQETTEDYQHLMTAPQHSVIDDCCSLIQLSDPKAIAQDFASVFAAAATSNDEEEVTLEVNRGCSSEGPVSVRASECLDFLSMHQRKKSTSYSDTASAQPDDFLDAWQLTFDSSSSPAVSTIKVEDTSNNVPNNAASTPVSNAGATVTSSNAAAATIIPILPHSPTPQQQIPVTLEVTTPPPVVKSPPPITPPTRAYIVDGKSLTETVAILQSMNPNAKVTQQQYILVPGSQRSQLILCQQPNQTTPTAVTVSTGVKHALNGTTTITTTATAKISKPQQMIQPMVLTTAKPATMTTSSIAPKPQQVPGLNKVLAAKPTGVKIALPPKNSLQKILPTMASVAVTTSSAGRIAPLACPPLVTKTGQPLIAMKAKPEQQPRKSMGRKGNLVANPRKKQQQLIAAATPAHTGIQVLNGAAKSMIEPNSATAFIQYTTASNNSAIRLATLPLKTADHHIATPILTTAQFNHFLPFSTQNGTSLITTAALSGGQTFLFAPQQQPGAAKSVHFGASRFSAPAGHFATTTNGQTAFLPTTTQLINHHHHLPQTTYHLSSHAHPQGILVSAAANVPETPSTITTTNNCGGNGLPNGETTTTLLPAASFLQQASLIQATAPKTATLNEISSCTNNIQQQQQQQQQQT